MYKYITSLLALQLISLLAISAQRPVFQYLRENEGLTSNSQWSSNSILEDSLGFIWIATDKGLNKYDGYFIQSYNGEKGSPYDLPYRQITAIAKDCYQHIWLGTEEEGLIKYDPKSEIFTKFKSEDYLADSISFTQINVIEPTPEGDLYIGTAFQGVFKYFARRDSLAHLSINHDQYSIISTNNLLLLKNNELAVASNNGVFIGNPNIKNAPYSFYPIEKKYFIDDIVELHDGKVNVYTQNRIDYYQIDPIKKTITSIYNATQKFFNGALVDPNENLWTNWNDGILIKENLLNGKVEKFSFFTDINGSRIPIQAKDLIHDNEGSIYYNSYKTGAGKFNYEPLPFQFALKKGSTTFQIWNEKLYVAIADSIYTLENGMLNPVPLMSEDNGEIFHFFIDSKNHFWVSKSNRTDFFEHFDAGGNLIKPKYNERGFVQMEELQNGDITVGTELYFLKNVDKPYQFIGNFYEKASGEAYPDFMVKHYLQSQDGTIWLATFASGIITISADKKEYTVLPIDENGNGKLNTNNIGYLFESSKGIIYACGDKGINIWYPTINNFVYLTQKNTGISLDVKGMCETENGHIWMVLKDYVAEYIPEQDILHSYPLHPDFRISRIESQDLEMDSEGRIYYQGQFGIVTFNPSELEVEAAPNNVLFIDLFINRNKIYPEDETNILDASLIYQHSFKVPFIHRDVGFSFVSLFGKDVLAKYYYRLKGYNNEWEIAPENRTIHFTSLPAGNYSFEVKAQSGNGKWTNGISKIDFTIFPPWYASWWAYFIYALAILSIVYSLYSYRIRQLTKYQNLRTKISSDLHDDVGSILGSIAMESEMLSYQKENSLSKELKRLSVMSRDAMSRMRDTVWAIDSRKDKVGFLTDRMKDYLSETISRSTFSYNFNDHTNLSDKTITPDIRQDVYLIFKEAINNILKHSSGANIEVLLTQENKMITLGIKDDGENGDLPINTSGLGISNMKMRAERIKGELTFHRVEGFHVFLKFRV